MQRSPRSLLALLLACLVLVGVAALEHNPAPTPARAHAGHLTTQHP